MGEVNKRWDQICETRRKFLAGEVSMDDVFDSNLDRLMRNYTAAEVGMTERGVTPYRVRESEGASRAVQTYFYEAVMAEREACAMIAHEYPLRNTARDGSGYWVAEEIAGCIRERA